MGKKKISEEEKIKTRLILKGNKNGYFQNDTDIEFAVSKKTNLYKKVSDKPIFPVFNNDDNHFTPGFTLKFVDSPTTSDYLLNHTKKVQQSLLQIDQSQILVPKPRSKNKYCGVCRDNYEDYLEHISSQSHFTRLQRNSSHQLIKMLCGYFHKKYLQCQNQRQTQKSISITNKINEDENSTESFIDQQKNNKNQQIYVSLEIIN